MIPSGKSAHAASVSFLSIMVFRTPRASAKEVAESDSWIGVWPAAIPQTARATAISSSLGIVTQDAAAVAAVADDATASPANHALRGPIAVDAVTPCPQ